MPEVGEIKQGGEIGKNATFSRYIWVACANCGKERWVQYYSGKPCSNICKHCAAKPPKLRGEKSYLWRGGRHKNSQGYIDILLQPDDFFFSMAQSSGYVKEHRLVMAKSLGRNLHPWEIVHHKNHKRADNRIENLQLVSDGKHKQITVIEGRVKYLESKVAEQDKLIKLLQWQLKEYANQNYLNL